MKQAKCVNVGKFKGLEKDQTYNVLREEENFVELEQNSLGLKAKYAKRYFEITTPADRITSIDQLPDLPYEYHVVEDGDTYEIDICHENMPAGTNTINFHFESTPRLSCEAVSGSCGADSIGDINNLYFWIKEFYRRYISQYNQFNFRNDTVSQEEEVIAAEKALEQWVRVIETEILNGNKLIVFSTNRSFPRIVDWLDNNATTVGVPVANNSGDDLINIWIFNNNSSEVIEATQTILDGGTVDEEEEDDYEGDWDDED